MAIVVIILGLLFFINGLFMSLASVSAMHQTTVSIYLVGGTLAGAAGLLLNTANRVAKSLGEVKAESAPAAARRPEADAVYGDKLQTTRRLMNGERQCPNCGTISPASRPVCVCGKSLT